MIPLAWREIEALALGELRGPPADGVVRRVHDDSRDARPGDLFVALNTGVRFVEDALAAGAATLVPEDQEAALAALAQLVRGRSDAAVVAVVGSTGKTTTKDALGALCSAVTPTVAAYASKSDYAYMRVRELILSGELEPGEVINQETLAARIGISTTPLREALRRLKQSGLVELGTPAARVSQLNAEEARDLLELRRSLDPMAVALAADRRTRADIAAIRSAAEGLQPLPGHPPLAMLVAHRRFHTTLYEASHNDLLIETLDRLWDKADRYRLHGLQVERSDEERAQKAHEHSMLVELIISGDGEGAAQVMRSHIDTSLGAKSAWRLMKPAENPASP